MSWQEAEALAIFSAPPQVEAGGGIAFRIRLVVMAFAFHAAV